MNAQSVLTSLRGVGPSMAADSAESTRSALLVQAGLTDYQPAWDTQRRMWAKRVAGEIPDAFLFVEHPHTYTLGVRCEEGHVLWSPERRREKGVQMVQIDRGGDVTYHGPGQIVMYPILHLHQAGLDLHTYLRAMEESVIRTLAEFGVQGGRVKEHTGVWVAGEKIAAIGIKVSKWVTMHGLALNVAPDLSYFGGIVPCGLTKPVTSLSRLAGRDIAVREVLPALVRHVADVFRVRFTEVSWSSAEVRA